MKVFKNIKSFFPKNSEQTKKLIVKCHKIKGPTFVSLKIDKQIGKNRLGNPVKGKSSFCLISVQIFDHEFSKIHNF